MAGKTLWGVCALSDEDFSHADPLIGTLQLTAEYLSMGFGGVLLGYGNKPGEVLNDASGLAKATTFFAQSPARLAAQ